MRAIYTIRATVFFFAVVIYWEGYAQPDKLRFEHITSDQGLPNNTAIRIMQDQKGYIWVGTYNGLCKFDGYNFTTYQFDPDDTSSIGGNVIRFFWETQDGKIWVLAKGSGTFIFDRTTEKFTQLSPVGKVPLDLNCTVSLIEDDEGKLWMNDCEGRLGRYDRKKNSFIGQDYVSEMFGEHKPTISVPPRISLIRRSKTGDIWLSGSHGLHRLKLIPQGKEQPAKTEFTHYAHEAIMDNLYEDRQGMLWFSGSCLNQFNPKTGVFSQFVSSPGNPNAIYGNQVTGIAEDKQGNLWVSTEHVLNKLNRERTSFTHYKHDPDDPTSINGKFIYDVFMDRSNILWLGTVTGGLEKVDLNQNRIVHYRNNPSNPHSLSNDEVAAICEDKAGTIWLGTIGGGLNAWDKQKDKFKRFRHDPLNASSLGTDFVSAVIEAMDGTLWIGGGQNSVAILSRLDRKTGTFRNYRFKYFFPNTYGNPVLTLYEDSKGLIWVGTSGGVSYFDPRAERWVHYRRDGTNPQGLSDYWANAICEDRKGNFWIGHNSNALDKLDPKTGTITRYVHSPRDSSSISSSIVKSICKDSRGTLWFATRHGGLCRLNEVNETFSSFTRKDGLPSNTVYSVLEDNDGNLWLTTNKGLSCFSPFTMSFTNYDVNDGFQFNEFEIRPEHAGGCFKGRDGTLYFGGPTGFNVFHPRDLHTNKIIPPVVITQFALFDKPLPGKNEASEIILSYDQNFFSLEFSALNYSNSGKNQYAYQLVGIDKDWVYSGNRRNASYTNMAPGNYLFRVKASNDDGMWNEEGVSIEVRILPPWWLSWWAYLFYTVAASLLVYLSVRSYINGKLQRERDAMVRQRAIQSERSRISSELHDDLGGELSTIRLLSEINDVPGTNTQQRLIKISALSSNLVQKMNEIVWALNVNNDSLQSLVAYMRRYVVKYLDDAGIKCLFAQPAAIPDYPIDGVIRRNTFLLLKEALHNVVKHAGAKEVQIAVAIDNGLEITIHDDGKGIPVEELEHTGGNGLRNMYQRIKVLNGQMRVTTGCGTTLHLSFPFFQNHTKV